jgi:hypothetical protein
MSFIHALRGRMYDEPGSEQSVHNMDRKPTVEADVVVTLAVTVALGIAALPIDGLGWVRALAAVGAFVTTIQLFGRFPGLAEKVVDVLLSGAVSVLTVTVVAGAAVLAVGSGISISASVGRVVVAAGSGMVCQTLPTLIARLRCRDIIIPAGVWLVVLMAGLMAGLAFWLLGSTGGVVSDSPTGAAFVGVVTVSFINWLAWALTDDRWF